MQLPKWQLNSPDECDYANILNHEELMIKLEQNKALKQEILCMVML